MESISDKSGMLGLIFTHVSELVTFDSPGVYRLTIPMVTEYEYITVLRRLRLFAASSNAWKEGDDMRFELIKSSEMNRDRHIFVFQSKTILKTRKRVKSVVATFQGYESSATLNKLSEKKFRECKHYYEKTEGDMSLGKLYLNDTSSNRELKMKKITRSSVQDKLNLKRNDENQILFRLLEDSFIQMTIKKGKVKCDIRLIARSVRENSRLHMIPKVDPPRYEIEVVMENKSGVNKVKPSTERTIVETLTRGVSFILKGVYSQMHLISLPIAKLAMKHLQDSIKDHVQIRKPWTLTLEYALDKVDNNYAVTSKADGERHWLYIFNASVYLVSNIQTKNCNLKLIAKLKNRSLDNTILDGELIWCSEFKKFAFLSFDIIYDCGEDCTQTSATSLNFLKDRLIRMDRVLKSLGYPVVFHEKFPIANPGEQLNLKRHRQMFEDYMKMNKELMSSSDGMDVVVLRKLYMFPSAETPNDVYKLVNLIWNENLEKGLWKLDGIILTPINQIYNPNNNSSYGYKGTNKYNELKWKPINQSSIDFQTKLMSRKDEGQALPVHPDQRIPLPPELMAIPSSQRERLLKQVGYVVNGYCKCCGSKEHKYEDCDQKTDEEENHEDRWMKHLELMFHWRGPCATGHLRVVKTKQRNVSDDLKETMEFMEEFGYNQVHLPLDMHTFLPKAMDGNVIRDGHVIEYIWMNRKDLPRERQWVALRVRHDKVVGNSVTNAQTIFDTITQPNRQIRLEDIKQLAEGNFMVEKKRLFNRLRQNADIDTGSKQSDMAYLNLKAFMAFAQKNVLLKVCRPVVKPNKSSIHMKVLDLNLGKNLALYAEAQVGVLTSVVPVKAKSMVNVNSFERNQKAMQKLYDWNPAEVHNIQGDFKASMDLATQSKLFDLSTNELRIHKRVMTKREEYDVISAFDTIPRYFESNKTLDAFLGNVKVRLASGGCLIATYLDADAIMERLEDDGDERSIAFQTNSRTGQQIGIKLSIPKDVNLDKLTVGTTVTITNTMLSQKETVDKEYLVNHEHFVRLMRERGFYCYDSGLFSAIIEMQRESILTMHKYKAFKPRIKLESSLDRIAKFITGKDTYSKIARAYCGLFRYVVFLRV